MTQLCVVPVYLFSGVLMDRIKAQIERLREQYPQIAFALGTHFGFDKGIFELLDTKVAGAELPEGGLHAVFPPGRHQPRQVVLQQVVGGAVPHRLDRRVLADLARDQDEGQLPAAVAQHLQGPIEAK